MKPVSLQFEGFTLDLARLQLRGPAGQVSLRPKAFEVLRYLAENAGRVVTKPEVMQAVWPDVTVTDESLKHCVSEIRRALDDRDQRMVKTVPRRGYLFNAPVTADESPVPTLSAGRHLVGAVDEPADAAGTVSGTVQSPVTALRQDIRFCTSSDGVRIAYAISGNGPPLVKAANWLSHLEYDWESPFWRHLLRGLTAEHQLIRYDERGNGLSDWEADDISFEAFVRDLECVVDAAGLDRFPLFGISQGCAVSIAYAVRHPQRVSHLILYGGYANGPRVFGASAEFEALATLVGRGWGHTNPAFRQIFTSKFIPGGTPEQVQQYNDLMRITASPKNAVRILRALATIDVTDLLAQVQVPTLVLHCHDDAAVQFSEGRGLAAGIPGARFVTLEGRNHAILESDPAWPRFFEEIRNFLKR